jgi:hypothetical protein
MSTRNMTLVVDRSHAEEFEKGFAVKPQLVSDKAYVHMYLHQCKANEVLQTSAMVQE